ncbi:hypothetical protein LNQ82_02175 [Conchiformibius steedae DSM 2580]|uniref:Lipoprotein n=1 Tax=Conchiformibius steedae DSM 2580 TaxID=1121352 RepID=A0AAE9L0J9_9NEIS|nr:hypothetical protein [Conchiformibius steedae]QMT33346.1 hypothetical protein H3L98_09705 [Conchiformibius steedae]URD67990.1 hypothetical protein LNQ82_02175 [Conchiformibius steedae DSM 2580]
MKQIKLVFPLAVGLLAGCSAETDGQQQAASVVKTTLADTDFASAAASSPIATQILNSPQEQDILSSSRQAMEQLSASDILAASAAVAAQASVPRSSDALMLPALAPACERYFRRAEQCFSRTDNGDALVDMSREAQEELAHEQPDEESCLALNRSFDAVARNLGCE